MQQHFERYGIYYLIGMVILIGIAVCFVAYRPIVGTELSNDNADWGNFGAFFWGLGTMCFTLLNAIIFYAIYQRLYRKQFFDTYRAALEGLMRNCKNPKDARIDIVNMAGVLGGMSNVSAFNKNVREGIEHLLNDCFNYLDSPSNDGLSTLIGKLTAFQICLITNEYHGNFAPDASQSNDTRNDVTALLSHWLR